MYCSQCVQILIGNLLILLLFFQPGIYQVAPRPEFAVETARPGRVLAANLKLAGTLYQAVGDPALEGRIVIGESAGREVESIPVGNTVARIYFAANGNEGEEHQ